MRCSCFPTVLAGSFLLDQTILGSSTLCSQLKKFRETTEQLSRNSGLEYEQSFLAVAVKLFQCLVQNAPAVVVPDLLIQTINGNPEVRGYIERQGGWVS